MSVIGKSFSISFALVQGGFSGSETTKCSDGQCFQRRDALHRIGQQTQALPERKAGLL